MSTILGRWRQGRVQHEDHVNSPEDTLLRIESSDCDFPEGITEETWPTTPEGFEEMRARIDAAAPGEISNAERSDWNSACVRQRQYKIADFDRKTDQKVRTDKVSHETSNAINEVVCYCSVWILHESI